MGSPARRQINPIMRCWDQPHYGYAGTDDGRGTGQRLDTKRLTLMSGRPAGAYVIKNGEVDWRPAVDPNRIVTMVGLVAIAYLLSRPRVARARAKSRSRRAAA